MTAKLGNVTIITEYHDFEKLVGEYIVAELAYRAIADSDFYGSHYSAIRRAEREAEIRRDEACERLVDALYECGTEGIDGEPSWGDIWEVYGAIEDLSELYDAFSHLM